MSKKRISLCIFSGLIFFLFLVLKQLPANWVLAHAANQTRLFVPVQVSGTLWEGQAANIIVKSGAFQLALGEVKWRLSALSLLTGTVALDIEALNGEQKLSGHFELGMDESIYAENLSLAIDATLFKPFAPMPIEYEGFIEMDLQDFAAEKISTKTPAIKHLSGNLVVKDLAVNFGVAVELGTYGLRLGLSDKKVNGENIITIKPTDVDASVAVSGDVQVLASSQNYYVNVALKPGPNANPQIANTLSQFYKKQPDGFYKILLGQPL